MVINCLIINKNRRPHRELQVEIKKYLVNSVKLIKKKSISCVGGIKEHRWRLLEAKDNPSHWWAQGQLNPHLPQNIEETTWIRVKVHKVLFKKQK